MEMVTIRRMGVSDVPRIVELERKIFSLPWTRRQFRSELKNPHSFYFVAVQDKEIVGYVGFVCVEDEGYVTNLAVDEGYRRRHIGTLLMVLVFRVAKSKGVRRISLDVRSTNFAAQSLYFKFGFKQVGVRPGYYSDTHEDALVLATDYMDDRTYDEIIARNLGAVSTPFRYEEDATAMLSS